MKGDNTAITLRRGRREDALCLGVLATQVFLDTYASRGIRTSIANEVVEAFSTEAFNGLLDRADTHFVVAECEDCVVGFAQATIGTAQLLAPAGSPAELDRLYVQEPFTGRGLGSRLLRSAEDLSTQGGAEVLWLSPWVGNRRALRFYARHGYADFGQVYFRMGHERVENRVYAKRLSRENRNSSSPG